MANFDSSDNIPCYGKCPCTVCGVNGDSTVRQIMAYGYAAATVILTFGFTALAIAICIMAFNDPTKGQTFLTIFFIPLATSLALYLFKSKDNAKKLME